MSESIKIVHYAGKFLNKSETFIGRFVQNSTQWSQVIIMAETFEDVSNISDSGKLAIKYKIKPYFYNEGSVKGFFRRICEYFLRVNLHYYSIKKLLEKVNPDIVHCHFGRLGVRFTETYLYYNLAVPFLVSFYGYDATKLPQNDKKYKENLQLIFKHANGILVEGPVLKKKMISLGAAPGKVLVNPLLLPVNDYPVKQTFYKPGQECTFLCAGRFVEKKGFHLFLEAIGQIKKELPKFNIIMIGEGPMHEFYNTIIEKYNLSRYVKFSGWLGHEQLIICIQECDFFVHPSVTAKDGDSEGGAPTILLEAQAIKTPVIASKHADIPYVMGYEEFLCNEGDIESLKSVILKAVNSLNLDTLVEQGYQKVLHQHDITSNIYRNIIESAI